MLPLNIVPPLKVFAERPPLNTLEPLEVIALTVSEAVVLTVGFVTVPPVNMFVPCPTVCTPEPNGSNIE